MEEQVLPLLHLDVPEQEEDLLHLDSPEQEADLLQLFPLEQLPPPYSHEEDLLQCELPMLQCDIDFMLQPEPLLPQCPLPK